jgi:hypothetical protein
MAAGLGKRSLHVPVLGEDTPYAAATSAVAVTIRETRRRADAIHYRVDFGDTGVSFAFSVPHVGWHRDFPNPVAGHASEVAHLVSQYFYPCVTYCRAVLGEAIHTGGHIEGHFRYHAFTGISPQNVI